MKINFTKRIKDVYTSMEIDYNVNSKEERKETEKYLKLWLSDIIPYTIEFDSKEDIEKFSKIINENNKNCIIK